MEIEESTPSVGKLTNSFDSIAWVYDSLAKLVFGDTIQSAQLEFLAEIKPSSSVLIIGGGTGWILNELDSLSVSINVDYIEASVKMLEKSKLRGPFRNIEVRFIRGTQDSIQEHTQYNVIITNFFLDVFTEDNLLNVMQKLDSSLSEEGTWMMTDFVENGKWWQRLLVKMMYSFFRITTRLEGRELQNFDYYFRNMGYSLIKEMGFFKQMIASRIYAK